jgi:SAM-dependent methyltransferase
MTQNDFRNDPWSGNYKIPWNDPDFSRRMLREHLSQDHDLASRRTEWIDRQVQRLHRYLLRERPSQILDLGCGPGFYSHRLAALGHSCHGIDFSPASIKYANSHMPESGSCSFSLGDLRTAAFEGPHDLVLLLYGEMNVFSPAECSEILRKASLAVRKGGHLIIEPQTVPAAREAGHAATATQHLDSGLFSDDPHTCVTESSWLKEHSSSLQTFRITDKATGSVTVYRNTTRALSDEQITEMLASAGFGNVRRCDSWPVEGEALSLWRAEKMGQDHVPLR